jgi:hypothetical protein
MAWADTMEPGGISRVLGLCGVAMRFVAPVTERTVSADFKFAKKPDGSPWGVYSLSSSQNKRIPSMSAAAQLPASSQRPSNWTTKHSDCNEKRAIIWEGEYSCYSAATSNSNLFSNASTLLRTAGFALIVTALSSVKARKEVSINFILSMIVFVAVSKEKWESALTDKYLQYAGDN